MTTSWLTPSTAAQEQRTLGRLRLLPCRSQPSQSSEPSEAAEQSYTFSLRSSASMQVVRCTGCTFQTRSAVPGLPRPQQRTATCRHSCRSSKQVNTSAIWAPHHGVAASQKLIRSNCILLILQDAQQAQSSPLQQISTFTASAAAAATLMASPLSASAALVEVGVSPPPLCHVMPFTRAV